MALCRLNYGLGTHHNAKVYNLEIVAGKHHTCDILAYVVHIALNGSNQVATHRMSLIPA